MTIGLDEMVVYWRIVMMRGLGYSISETAESLHMTYNQIRYRLGLLHGLAQEKGPVKVFFQICYAFFGSEGLREMLR